METNYTRTDLYLILVSDEEEQELLFDTIVKGDENAKNYFLRCQELYCNGYHVRTVDAHPVYFDDKGVQRVDHDTWITW